MRLLITLLATLALLPVATLQDAARDIPYGSPSVERQVLDIYAPKDAKNLPVVFWIHGGGWQTGDKSSVQEKPRAFVERGFVFVSTNYRLLPKVEMLTIFQDVAKSLGWVYKHIAEYGGDANRIFVMGHSAGAQLAALLCTDERYLKAEGVPFLALKGCVPVDGDTYDVPAIIETGEARRRAHGEPQPKFGHREKFGNDPEKHRDYSAVTHVAKGKGIPPFLILYVADHPDTTAQARRLASVLKEAEVPATLFGAKDTNHTKLNDNLGVPGGPATKALDAFVSGLISPPLAQPPKGSVETPPDSPGPGDALKPFVERRAIAGAVTLVATKDRILSLQAVGFADLSAQTKMRPDALFWIASQSKPMTAVAVMMLVDEGRISLDDPVEKFLPEFKGQKVVAEKDGDHEVLRKPVHPITVRNVLSHTSGLRFSSPMERPTLDRLTLEDSVRSHALLPLQWEPGSKYQYSNAGINVAARILEVVSQEPYAEFMRKRLFDPLGMKDTTFWPSPEQVDRLAKAYKPNARKDDLEETRIGQLTYPLSDRHRQPMPAGGLFSTAADVARFCQMMLRGGEFEGRRYLSEKSVALMTSKQTADSIKEGYGLGWSTGTGSFGHGGAFATGMTIDTAHGLILIYMVQHTGDGGKCHGVFKQAAQQMFGK